jgi:hypothetical protein
MAAGAGYRAAAQGQGRRRGEAVAHPVSRFNQKGSKRWKHNMVAGQRWWMG